MKGNSLLIVGFFVLMAGTAFVNVENSFATTANRVDVIATINESIAQVDSKSNGKAMRVDVIGSIGSEGPAYSYTKPISR